MDLTPLANLRRLQNSFNKNDEDPNTPADDVEAEVFSAVKSDKVRKSGHQ